MYLDGAFQKSIDLGLKNFPRLAQVVVFGAYDLPRGRHTIRIVNKAAACVVLDAFKVYGG